MLKVVCSLRALRITNPQCFVSDVELQWIRENSGIIITQSSLCHCVPEQQAWLAKSPSSRIYWWIGRCLSYIVTVLKTSNTKLILSYLILLLLYKEKLSGKPMSHHSLQISSLSPNITHVRTLYTFPTLSVTHFSWRTVAEACILLASYWPHHIAGTATLHSVVGKHFCTFISWYLLWVNLTNLNNLGNLKYVYGIGQHTYWFLQIWVFYLVPGNT